MKKKIIKIISTVLIAAFVAQDAVWASEEIFRRNATTGTLQIPLMTGTLRADEVRDSIDAKLQQVVRSMSLAGLREDNPRFTIEVRGIRLIVNFRSGAEGILIADCKTETNPPARYQFTYDEKEFLSPEPTKGSATDMAFEEKAKKELAPIAETLPAKTDAGGASSSYKYPIFEVRIPKRYTGAAFTRIYEKAAIVVIKMREVLGEKAGLVEDTLCELVLNFMEHARGGIIRLYAEKDDSGAISKLIISAEDNGPGLGKDPNDLVRVDLKLRINGDSYKGHGFLVITFLPDNVRFRHGGDEWVRISRNINDAQWYKKSNDVKVGGNDAQGTKWSLEFNLGPGEDAVNPLRIPEKTYIITKGVSQAQEVKAAPEEPIQFLRDIVDTKQLGQNTIEAILSHLFSDRRVALAFDTKLKGLKLQRVESLIKALEDWKRATAGKRGGMKKVLDNLAIFKYSTSDELQSKLSQFKLDDSEHNRVFAFTPKISDNSPNPAKLGVAVKTVLMDGEGEFKEGDYYPLLEVVTLALIKELLGWSEAELRDNLKNFGSGRIKYEELGINEIIEDEENRILIFKMLPKMSRYNPKDQVDRYARLLQFLRSA